MRANEELWIIVLAGGEGTRLAPLTRALYGVDLPKQFAVLAGERSLLQQTLDRAAQLAPPERTCVMVSAHHEPRARAQLRSHPGVELVVQPRSLDTAPAILFPVARIRARNPLARIAVLPADHYFQDPGPLLAALRDSATGPARNRVALIGVTPEHAETEYGWIVCGNPLGRCRAAFGVRRFEEKPDERTAGELRARGALWNTFISVGPVGAFWRLARTHLPHQASLLDRYRAHRGILGETTALDELYRALPPANFSRDLLAHAHGLAVIPVAGTGWSDWGSPQRVFQSLAGTQDHTALLGRLAATRPDVPAAIAAH